MSTTVTMGWDILERIERAVLKVRERLLRATKALNDAGIPYAVVGGHAVASWVATIDEGAVRNTGDVNILVRREDLPTITVALQNAGFVADENPAGYRVLTLDSLLLMKLMSNRDKDRTHLRDMVQLGILDESWLDRLPAELAERLRHLLETPEG